MAGVGRMLVRWLNKLRRRWRYRIMPLLYGGPPRIAGWQTWSGPEGSSQSHFLQVPGVRLATPPFFVVTPSSGRFWCAPTDLSRAQQAIMEELTVAVKERPTGAQQKREGADRSQQPALGAGHPRQ